MPYKIEKRVEDQGSSTLLEHRCLLGALFYSMVIRFAFVSSVFFGITIFRTPFLEAAEIFELSTVFGKLKRLKKEP